jgi:hypothetical protein
MSGQLRAPGILHPVSIGEEAGWGPRDSLDMGVTWYVPALIGNWTPAIQLLASHSTDWNVTQFGVKVST